ncbi:MAG TPA: hypothetical protein VGI04_13180 [Neobacillus sp.]|jgi:hypothetical protein
MRIEAVVKQLIHTHLLHYGDVNELVNEAANEFTGIIKLAEKIQSISR